MSSGLNFMYGHVFGSHSRKPHIDTVRAIRKSNVDPYITAPFGVDPAIARPGPRNSPFVDQMNTQTTTKTETQEEPGTNDIDDIINMITSDPELKSKPLSKGQRLIRKMAQKN
jgi:hypothetical protein